MFSPTSPEILLHIMTAILPVEGTHWLIAIFVYLEWLSETDPSMWRNAMQSVKSTHIQKRSSTEPHWLSTHVRRLLCSAPMFYFQKSQSKPLSLGCGSLSSWLAQAEWRAVIQQDWMGEIGNLRTSCHRATGCVDRRNSKLASGDNNQMQKCTDLSSPSSHDLP